MSDILRFHALTSEMKRVSNAGFIMQVPRERLYIRLPGVYTSAACKNNPAPKCNPAL